MLIRPQFIALTLLCLVAWGLPSPVTAADYEEWKAPNACIFGMPQITHAVGLDGKGSITDLIKIAFEGAGYELQYKNIPYKRTLTELKAGIIHCTLDIKGAQKNITESVSTLALFDMAVAYRITDGFKGIESMAGTKVAYRHGFNLQAFLPVKILPQLAYDLTSALHRLDRGHIRYVLDDERVIKRALFEARLPSTEFGITVLKKMQVHLIFSQTEEGKKLRDTFDERMVEMIQNGKLQESLAANGLSPTSIDRILKANGH